MNKTILLFLFAVSLVLIPLTERAGAETQPDTVAYTIANCINEFKPDRSEKTTAGYQYWFADKSFAGGKTLKMSVVAPHKATHPPHAHPEDEFFFILEGSAECFLNGEKKIVGKYASFYCPSGITHGIRNVGDTELKYLVIKKYESGR
jgi:quercetin dioxygenase-like cupin family protein